MLQQTRATAVIPYFERFLARFPNVRALATARERDLLAAWAGLGYYSRVRNLQRAARQIDDLGEFPTDYASLRSLAGIGDYTAAAIASIAFDQPHAVLDGNVVRVLSRFTGEAGNVSSSAVRKQLLQTAQYLLDPRRPSEFNQAMMELGATVCLPKQPRCPECPLGDNCVALQLGRQQELPVKSAPPIASRVNKKLLVIENANRILMWQRPGESMRLAGFWELPESGHLTGVQLGSKIGKFRHTIVNTNFHFEVYRAAVKAVPNNFHWMLKKKLDVIPVSTVSTKALMQTGITITKKTLVR